MSAFIRIRCLGSLIKRNYFDTCTYLVQEYFSNDTKKLSSKCKYFVDACRGRECGEERC